MDSFTHTIEDISFTFISKRVKQETLYEVTTGDITFIMKMGKDSFEIEEPEQVDDICDIRGKAIKRYFRLRRVVV